jgi:hypothetical protein
MIVKTCGRSATSLIFQVALLAVMLLAHVAILLAHWMLAESWGAVAVQRLLISLIILVVMDIVVMTQGLKVATLCGWSKLSGPIGRYGILVASYGLGSSGLAFWLLLFAAFGGPARDDIPLFAVQVLSLASVICIPSAIYLRRWGLRVSGSTV